MRCGPWLVPGAGKEAVRPRAWVLRAAAQRRSAQLVWSSLAVCTRAWLLAKCTRDMHSRGIVRLCTSEFQPPSCCRDEELSWYFYARFSGHMLQQLRAGCLACVKGLCSMEAGDRALNHPAGCFNERTQRPAHTCRGRLRRTCSVRTSSTSGVLVNTCGEPW